MLSKAATISLLSLRAYHKPPSTKLFAAAYQSLPPCFSSSVNLYKVPSYCFANNKKNSERVPEKTTENDEKTEEAAYKYKRGMIEEGEEELSGDFINFMQKDTSQTGADYTYANKTIFHVDSRKDDFTKKYIFYWGMGSVWLAVSFLTFNYINPWVAIIPVWFLAGSMMTIRMASKFAKTMLKKIELVDSEHITIYPLSLKGKGVLCNIKDTEVLGIKVLSASPPGKDGKTGSVKSYLIMANFTESAKGKSYSRMRLIVDPKLTSVTNIDLLKAILYGQTEEVGKYEYAEQSEEAKRMEEEKKEKDSVIDVEGKAQFEFKEEEFEQLRKEFKREKPETDEKKEGEEKQNEK